MNYHNITCPDMNNGDGLRVVLWLSGCSHHCYNCQNQQTWDKEGGILFDEEAKSELLIDLAEDYISGITLSGGDPLYLDNLQDVYDLLHKIIVSFQNKTVWIYTGYTWEDIFSPSNDIEKSFILRRKIIEMSDVLVDGRYVDSERDVTLKWRGSKNQRVINVQESLKQGQVVLWCD